MSRLILCGITAKHPLYIDGLDINIYTMEELCYYLYNNIYMVGQEFFTENLIDFVENELGLKAVAMKLRYDMDKNKSYTVMINDILEGSSYYLLEEREAIESELKKLSTKTPAERIKSRADALVESKKYGSALKTYRSILEKKDIDVPASLLADVWNNMGIIFARKFMYTDAVSCFEMAYDIERKEKYKKNLIYSIVLMEVGETREKYMRNVMDRHKVTEEEIKIAEKQIESEMEGVLSDKEVRETLSMLSYGDKKDMNTYYEQVDEILESWKMQYREQIQ